MTTRGEIADGMVARRGISLRAVTVFGLAISAFALTASCGSSDLDACKQYFAAFCAREAACEPHEFSFSYAQDPDTCTERQSLLCPLLTALPNTNFHGDPLSSCSNAIAQMSCDEFEGAAPAVCLNMYRGTLQAGDACVDDSQCPSAFCVRPKGAIGEFPCGVCAGLAMEGDACSEKNLCDVGLRCASHVCIASLEQGDSCDNVADCDVGLTCLDGLCDHPRALGDLCSHNEECNGDDFQFCDAVTQSCQPIPVSYWRGACASEYPYCQAGFYCDINPFSSKGTCVPAIADGDDCAGVVGSVNPCYEPDVCTAGTCQLPEVAACGSP